MNWHTGIPEAPWDTQLFAAGGDFLQSSHWAAFQVALEKKVFFAQGAGWQCLAILERARTGKRLYCPYGPLAENKKALTAALEALTQLAREQGALFVRMEPMAPLRRAQLADYHLRPALKDIQPALTWVQDLTKTKEELLAAFTATNRNLYNNFVTKGLSFHASTDPKDVTVFLRMIHDVAAHTGMKPHTDHYYRVMTQTLLPRRAGMLYIAKHSGKPVAAAITFDSPTTRYYAHAGSLLAERKLHAGAPLVATMLFDAKQNGQKHFDFVGVAPADQPEHRLAGITKFKQSFGGAYKAHLGTWELPTHPLYRLYRGVYVAQKQLKRA